MGFSDKKKALDHWDGQGFLVVAEAGFEPTPSCGTRKNLRAVRLLDFFDRCAIPCSLYHPPDAVAGDAFENPPVVGFGAKEKSLNYWDS